MNPSRKLKHRFSGRIHGQFWLWSSPCHHLQQNRRFSKLLSVASVRTCEDVTLGMLVNVMYILYNMIIIYIYVCVCIFLRADAPRRLHRISRPSISSQCGLESFWMGTCFRNIVLMFLKKVHRIGTLLEIDGFFGEQVSSRKLLPRVFPEELLPISTCYFV